MYFLNLRKILNLNILEIKGNFRLDPANLRKIFKIIYCTKSSMHIKIVNTIFYSTKKK